MLMQEDACNYDFMFELYRHDTSCLCNYASAFFSGKRSEAMMLRARTPAITPSAASIGTWYHSEINIFTPIKDRMMLRPYLR